MTTRLGLLTGILCVALARPLLCSQQAAAEEPAVRGITISTHGSGRDWGTDRIVEAFKAVKDVGATWVTVHPYGWIRRDGSVRYRRNGSGGPPALWVRPIKEAQALGLKIFIKPHIGYWGSGFRWRGDITFESAEAWKRFFETYEDWIVAVARACSDADGFAVGTELDLTATREVEWRRIIKKVRAATSAPLTYAANWTHYKEIPFWDALDVVGIQAYFPVAETRAAKEAEIKAGWQRRMSECREFSRRTGLKIVFTELGYNRSMIAPVKPWDYKTDGKEAEPVQQRCLKVALEAVRAEPLVIGCFLWKWFPPPRPVGRNFQLATPGMKSVIKTAWGPP